MNSALKHTLFMANGNDFIDTVKDTKHPVGIDNPKQYFVFAIEKACRLDHADHHEHDDHGQCHVARMLHALVHSFSGQACR
ncbi:hypothetical protein [Caballeronia calidae]|uniref:hypothetical protein n=1 Tax=Caballeronia calidae TaxID=1777139 RepID=UPI00078938B2|nr:hypothetical protein [Caballeronia calidae]